MPNQIARRSRTRAPCPYILNNQPLMPNQIARSAFHLSLRSGANQNSFLSQGKCRLRILFHQTAHLKLQHFPRLRCCIREIVHFLIFSVLSTRPCSVISKAVRVCSKYPKTVYSLISSSRNISTDLNSLSPIESCSFENRYTI